jgi:hypothetical protein
MVHHAPHTAPCCRLRTPRPPPPLCPPAGSIQDQVGVGGRSGLHRRRRGGAPPGESHQLPEKEKKRRGTTAPHPPPQDRSPLPGHPSRAVPPYVYMYPWCQGAHPGTGSRPGPLAPAGGDPPQTSLPEPCRKRSKLNAQRAVLGACRGRLQGSVRDPALLAAAPARPYALRIFFVLFTTM